MLTPAERERIIDVFVAHEDVYARDIAMLRACDPHQVVELPFNVWTLHVDAGRDVVRYEHDFDPYEGEMPLHEFIAGLETRLPREGEADGR